MKWYWNQCQNWPPNKKKEKKNNEITDYCNWKSDDIEISAINMFGIENLKK